MVPEEDRLKTLGGRELYREPASSLASRRMRENFEIALIALCAVAICTLTSLLAWFALPTHLGLLVEVAIFAVASVVAVASLPLVIAARPRSSPFVILEKGFVPPDKTLDLEAGEAKRKAVFVPFDSVVRIQRIDRLQSRDSVLIVSDKNDDSYSIPVSFLRDAAIQQPSVVRHFIASFSGVAGENLLESISK